MSEKIKVWVAVDPKGLPYSSAVSGVDGRWAMVNAAMLMGTTYGYLERKGWTVQPYRLVKGHENE